jgi:ribosomal protein S24E
MDFKVISDKNNPLFNRREIEGFVNSQKTPSYLEVLEMIKDKYSVSEESIKIKKIEGVFGSKDFKVVVSIYESEEEKNKLERKDKKDVELEKKLAEIKESMNKPAEEPKTEDESKDNTEIENKEKIE